MTGLEGVDTAPRPRLSPDNRPFWEGCAAGRLMLPICEACGKPHLPPGPVCPFCLGDRLTWRAAAGAGTVTTWTMVHKAWFPFFADRVPYNVVQVELDEGPRLTARLADHHARPAVGQRVRVDFERLGDDLAVPVFQPIDD